MTLAEAAQLVNAELEVRQPCKFGSSWIFKHAPKAYHFVRLHLRTESGDIDWDTFTKKLNREFQHKWQGRRRKAVAYEDPIELERFIAKYQKRLYVFISTQSRKDEEFRDRISIRLVRIAQKGNSLALTEATTLIRYTADEWIERYPMLSRWKYNSELLDEQIQGCIRRYRFTGSFLGYLYKTLLYSGRGLRPVYSLDQPMWRDSEVNRSEYVVQDPETGEIKMYEKGMFSFT